MGEVQERKYDLTQGGILNKLLLISLPIMGTQFIQMSYNLVDMFLLGRVGSDAVAAAGTAGMYLWLSNGFLMIGRMGAEIGVAQNMGKGDIPAARKFSRNSLFLSVILGVLFAILCLCFANPLIGFFRIQEAHVASEAIHYLRITSLAVPFVFVSGAIAGTFNGSGNSRVPFLINSTGLFLNILLDPLFIFGFGMGVSGAATATVIAQTFVCILSIWALLRKKDRPFASFHFFRKPEKKRISQILKWSIPVGVENILFAFFTMFISRLVAQYGAGAIAVYRVGSQIESLTWLICVGFSTAVTAFVGQNYGAGNWQRIRGGTRISFSMITLWGVFVTLVLLFFGAILFRLFLPEEGLVEIGKNYLQILAVCQVLACWEAVAAGSFRGLGKTVPPFIVSTVTNGLRIPLAYLLSASLGLNGIWWAITIGAGCRGLWIFMWYLAKLRRANADEAR